MDSLRCSRGGVNTPLVSSTRTPAGGRDPAMGHGPGERWARLALAAEIGAKSTAELLEMIDLLERAPAVVRRLAAPRLALALAELDRRGGEMDGAA